MVNMRPRLMILGLGLAVLVGGGVYLYVRLRSVEYPIKLQAIEKIAPPRDLEPEHLETTALLGGREEHLLDGKFAIATQYEKIPENCKSPFNSSFLKSEGEGLIPMANPGEPFEFADAIAPGLPFRQLLFGGTGPDSCFIYYQHGGAMYPRYCMAVMRYSEPKAIWVGDTSAKVRNVDALRRLLRNGTFHTNVGPEC